MASTKERIQYTLVTLLADNEMSNTELARRLGVSKAAVTNWIKGANGIDIELVPQICDIFGISIDEFLGHGRASHELLQQDERRLVALYRAMDSRDKAVLMQMADSLSRGAAESTEGVA